MSKFEEQTSGYVKLRRGLPNLNKKLTSKEPIAVAFLGGSITEGYGASEPDKTSWRALTEHFLKECFSAAGATCINAGVGGTNSTFGAFRFKEHVLHRGKIDLLFVEFSVNDGGDREESIRGMEGIVRQCRRLSPDADICFVYTAAEKNLSAEMPFNIAVHEEVADRYGLPSVNLAARIYARIEAGQARWEELAPDLVHPNDAGYALYAQDVREFLNTALMGDVPSIEGSSNMALPSPLDDRNYEHGVMLNVREAAASHVGFTIEETVPEPLINWRYGAEHLCTDSELALLSFTVSGKSAGLLLFCGPDSGIFEYSLDGLTFHQVNLFDDWCVGAFRPVIAMFSLAGDQQISHITVRNTGLKDERSTGTGLRVLRVFSG